MNDLTIEFRGIEFDVTFYHQPQEAPAMYHRDGSGFPGCPASADISEITHNGTDFTEFLEGDIDEIEALILDKL